MRSPPGRARRGGRTRRASAASRASGSGPPPARCCARAGARARAPVRAPGQPPRGTRALGACPAAGPGRRGRRRVLENLLTATARRSRLTRPRRAAPARGSHPGPRARARPSGSSSPSSSSGRTSPPSDLPHAERVDDVEVEEQRELDLRRRDGWELEQRGRARDASEQVERRDRDRDVQDVARRSRGRRPCRRRRGRRVLRARRRRPPRTRWSRAQTPPRMSPHRRARSVLGRRLRRGDGGRARALRRAGCGARGRAPSRRLPVRRRTTPQRRQGSTTRCASDPISRASVQRRRSTSTSPLG